MILQNKDENETQFSMMIKLNSWRSSSSSSSSASSSSAAAASMVNPFRSGGCLYSEVFLTTVLIIIACLLSCFVPTSHAASPCNLLDRDALLSFSNNLSIISSPPLNWNSSSDCCTDWEGVGCDVTGRVTSLKLPSRGLSGIIAPSIANLPHLSVLILSRNSLAGILPDGFFTNLVQLQVIDLSYNRLAGHFSALGMLPGSIQDVDFSSNNFNGTIENALFDQASNLASFNISNNSFFGEIPFSLCSISPSITELDFSENHFNGSIPGDVGNCSSLQILRAGFNSLSGPLPPEIYRLSSLQEISFPGNKLNGSIANDIANLKNLTKLAFFGNELTGIIPPDIGMLSKLEDLELHVNKLGGNLPPSIINCTELTVIILRVNTLIGDLSKFNFSQLTKLTTIDLGNNYFTGALPETLFSCTSLTAIRLASNQITGEIPYSIQKLQSLQFLSISNNSLTNVSGALTVLQGCKNLSTLILSKSFNNEALPSNEDLIVPPGFQILQVLGLGGCQFTGEVPLWLLRLPKLEVIDLSYNTITSSIPSWLGTLPNLFYLDLSVNQLTGTFPVELTQLQRLARQQNNQVDQSYLELPVFVKPDNVSNLQYNQLSSLPPAIYLKSNHLSGDIPTEIGLLKFIHVLDLSDNNFTGTIPSTISNLTNLEKLDLSDNQLSGEIPASLGSLHFLSSFNVANNNLQGPIPTGGQFDTFPSTSFEGNKGLCGLVLQQPCTIRPKSTTPSATKKSPKKKIMIGLILGICFGIGITLSMVAFWILSKRRVIPKSDPEKDEDLEATSFNSTMEMSPEFRKDKGIVILFPNNTNGITDLTFSELLKATDDFNQSNIIGCGGFGLVYKATLTNGMQLAIKKLTGDMGLMEREFKAEVEALSTAQHENLVALQGYCVHDGFRLLIYTYMENGSLDYWLHEKSDGASQLDWPTRLRIAQDAGRGLAYMHQICEPHIVHRDIKSSNILLDKKFKAHVADFGLSRLILPYRTHVTTELVGTLGYIPPEYSQSWMATLRGDVYSFGVVMLELLTGKRPMEIFKPKVSRELVAWVQQMKIEGKQDEIFDPLLKGKGYEEEMVKVLDIACMCVNQNPFKRPAITEVVDCLNDVASNRCQATTKQEEEQ
ncbi:OLC1v1015272C1 [Oldenlandia corymbosa var. corymbosa]|uniref:non-specific serine/threonine protein kinase n=1 Tax=Oldenlandia corymbosa var. corymbosa TaxID=529605 RepID=A0AAV1E3L1_OLDCO|nr:OLC1v1015272C1 [Oldenlandia corymbosa var. corymbosa]